MFQSKGFHGIANGTMILLVLFLIGFEVVFRLFGGNTYGVDEVTLQRTRSQLLVNAVDTLAYRPMIEHGQALRNLQTVLPAFEHEQGLLQTNPATDVQNLLRQALDDYLPLITAMQSVITHSNSVLDPLVVNILVIHERGYLATMNTLMLLLPQIIEGSAIQLFMIQLILEIVFLATFSFAVLRVGGERKIKLLTLFLMLRLIMVVLVLVLIGLEIVPFRRGNETLYLDQATLQQVRCETFAASALVSTSRPPAERTLALSDTLVALLLFQQGQALLLTNKDGDVHRHVLQATSEYQIMSTAVQTFITQSNQTIDPVVVNTIVSHAQRCAATMSGIALVLQSQMDQQMTLIFFGEVAIEGALIIFFGALLLFLYDPFVSRKLRRGKGRFFLSQKKSLSKQSSA